MDNLKEFWDKQVSDEFFDSCDVQVVRERQGLFFWERGGKQFVLDVKDYSLEDSASYIYLVEYVKEANNIQKEFVEDATYTDITNARDFLDALDCLGEDKIKELIEAMK